MKIEANLSQEDIDMLVARLHTLSFDGANRASRKAIREGLRVLRDAMRASAPVGKTGSLRRSIGSRFRKIPKGQQKGVIEAKAGLNVGKKRNKGQVGGVDRPNDSYAPHAHLVALGTRPRWGGVTSRYLRRKGLLAEYIGEGLTGKRVRYAGIMPANPFVKWAAQRVGGSAQAVVRRRLETELVREVERMNATGAMR